jgi:SAM-dependent methyltransferase
MSQAHTRPTGVDRRSPYEHFGGDLAENYERYFGPVIPTPLAGELLEVAAPRPGERVLDVACGTGIVARLASQRVGSRGTVSGVDINAGMLAVARRLAPAGRSIEWHEAPAEELPLPDGSVDVVLCQLGLMFVADKEAALREMRRVLAPDGRVAILVPARAPQAFLDFEAALTDHIGPEAGAFVGFVFSLGDPGRLRELVSSAGFRDVAVETRTSSIRLPPPAEFLWQYVACTPLALMMGELDDDARAALERELVAKWEPRVDDGALAIELDDLIVMASR